jgi:hypothetical protein
MLLPKPFLLKMQHQAVWYSSQLPSFTTWFKVYIRVSMYVACKP